MSCEFERFGIFAAMGLLVTFAALPIFAVDSSANAPMGDGIDRTDPNFVKASLLVMGPGKELYSCAGHACFRLECPKFDLDYCFSYESEQVSDHVARFFLGELKMGMFAVKAEDFLSSYEKSGRGVVQYPLNLPPDAKQRLWKKLDEEVAEGAKLPYDYVQRGCARAVMKELLAAIEPYRLSVAEWPAKYEMSRREILMESIRPFPWTACFLNLIMGTEADRLVSRLEKVIIPSDLVAFLKTATINGMPVITENPMVVFKNEPVAENRSVAPWVVSVGLLMISLLNQIAKSSVVDIFFLSMQSVIGVFLLYLVAVSSLPATDWNWLLIPFNPLPLLLWRWRRHWALPFVAVLIAWEAYMLFNGHALTDPAFLVLAAAYMVFFLRFTPGLIWKGK